MSLHSSMVAPCPDKVVWPPGPGVQTPSPPDGLPPRPSAGATYSRSAGPAVGASEEADMRVESSVTSVSWIPSEAVTGPC